MIRFGSVAAGRSLRSQSANLIIGGTRNPTYQIPQSKYNTHAPTSEVPTAHDWATVNAADSNSFKWNKSQSEQEFDEILTEIRQRLRRVEVPHNARPYVFRPKNSQLLRSLHLTDKDGTPYQSEVWKGPPNRKQLMKLIRRVTNPETAAIATEILSSYINHYPSEVQSIHIGTFLRTAARAGFFYKVLDLIQTEKFRTLINDDVAKEAVRLYAIRAVTLDKDSADRELVKLFNKMGRFVPSIENDVGTHLLMVYGLAPHASTTSATQLSRHLAKIAELLQREQEIPADAKLNKYHGLQYHYMNLVLGRVGLLALPAELTAQVDMDKLDRLIAAIDRTFESNRVSSPLERYVKQAALGIDTETNLARAAERMP